MEIYPSFAVRMKKLFPNVETSVKTDTFRISKKIQEIYQENPSITDGDAWKYITDLCRARVTCYTPDELIKAYETLEKYRLQRGILKIESRITYREHDILVVFDYLHLLICEIEFKFHDTYPL